jgi:hypothetical protein
MTELERLWDGTPREQVLMWTMEKARKRARCAVWSHSDGWEVRITVNRQVVYSHSYRVEEDVFRDVTERREEFLRDKWRLIGEMH